MAYMNYYTDGRCAPNHRVFDFRYLKVNFTKFKVISKIGKALGLIEYGILLYQTQLFKLLIFLQSDNYFL